MAVDRAQQRVDVDEGPGVGAGQQFDPRAESGQVVAQHGFKLVGMPEGELPQQDPIVEGAYTPPERVSSRRTRTTATSSILSPAHMPAISVANFGAGWPTRT